MLNEKHREAEALAAEAALVRSKGLIDKALELYSRAADAEWAALSAIPSGKSRTRSVLSLSAASLLYKAERLDEAERCAFQLLGSASLEDWADRQLRELLQVISDEKALRTVSARRYSGESITVSLRGGQIGSGTAPFDLIIEKAAAFRSLLYRFAEWTGQYPLRVRGNPPKELLDLVEARVSEPAPGSYRLEVRLTEPLQVEMFGRRRVESQAVSDALFGFLDRLTTGTPEQLEEFVPQRDYRKALLQLTRSVTPSGKRVTEVGIYRHHDDRTQSVYLTDKLSSRIRRVLPPPEEPEKKRNELRGVLRALHLDKNWLELATPEGEHIQCDTVHDMLDDVVGPMVNHEVVVRGAIRRKYGKTKLMADEVVLAEES